MHRAHHESSSRLKTAQDIKNYIYGGNGIVTLKSSETGVQHTYVFAKPKNPNVFPDDVIFVYALHDNIKMFYVGMVERGEFRLTKSSRYRSDTEIVKGARYIMKMSEVPNLNTPMELYHEGVCCFCGRKLKSKKSIETGIGPRCKHRLKHDK